MSVVPHPCEQGPPVEVFTDPERDQAPLESVLEEEESSGQELDDAGAPFLLQLPGLRITLVTGNAACETLTF